MRLKLKYRVWRAHRCGKYTPRTGNSNGVQKASIEEGNGIRRRTYLGNVIR